MVPSPVSPVVVGGGSTCGSLTPYPIKQNSVQGENLTHVTADAFVPSKGQADNN